MTEVVARAGGTNDIDRQVWDLDRDSLTTGCPEIRLSARRRLGSTQ